MSLTLQWEASCKVKLVKPKKENIFKKKQFTLERPKEAHNLKRTHRKGKNRINKTGRYVKVWVKYTVKRLKDTKIFRETYEGENHIQETETL
jgi:hypothetical protein